jgi:HK97 gp10 family phage protein
MAAVVTFRGLRELDAAMRTLPDELQRAPARAGLKAGADVWKDGMARRAPRDPTPDKVTLADEIVSEIHANIGRDRGEARVGPSERAFYGGFQELGTVDFPAQPFMRPTADEDSQIATAALAVQLKEGIERAVKRMQKVTR